MQPPGGDAEVPQAFCRALGIPGLADVHVHFLPPRLLRRVWEYFDAAGPLVGIAWPIRYRWPDEQRVAHLRALGVRVFSALAYAHRPGMAADLNAWTLEFARATPGCLPSATFYPEPGVTDYVLAALDAGARVFKVHLQVGGFPADEPGLRPVWGLLAEAGCAGGGARRARAGGHGPHRPGAVRGAARPSPGADRDRGAPGCAGLRAVPGPRRGVRAGGAGHDDGVHAVLRAAHPVPGRALPRLQALGLAGKVLLGSDFPNIPYPYAEQIAGLVRLGLGEPWLRAVCWANAAHLFRLTAESS